MAVRACLLAICVLCVCLGLTLSRNPHVCPNPEADPSTQVVEINSTLAQYTCRVGYRFESGDTQRICEANGTWSGVQPICAVDSILPKAYLVVLIVGATIAVFLACIPYDFYRFRKRKKKVRDHQERLSLVTRIAPGHAKVVLETVSGNQNQMGYTQGRRFGFKSLFSVFRFVGGKMRSSHGHIDATNPVCADEYNAEGESNNVRGSSESAAPEPVGATASDYIFDPQSELTCPSSDVIPLCPLAAHTEFDSISRDLVGDLGSIPEEGDTRPTASDSPLLLDNNDAHDSLLPAKKGFQMFKKAQEIFSRDSDPNKNTSTTNRKAPPPPPTTDSAVSEPATVEVTSMNKSAASQADDLTPQDDAPASIITSPTSSTSSPEVALLKKGCPKADQVRTFHYPIGKNSVAYHSMPTITDIP